MIRRIAALNDCLKLTTYFGERDRAGGGFLADALVELYARHGLQASLVMRGGEGFGAKHHLHTDRLLTLSEALPLVSSAFDSRDGIGAAPAPLAPPHFPRLPTLERARVLPRAVEAAALPALPDGATQLTVSLGRREPYAAVVDVLHRRGVAGATVLLGVDGTAHGVRRRARFFDRNADVPLMVIAVGDGEGIGGALSELGAMLARPLMTLERVRVCKRDGQRLAAPDDPSAEAGWQKLMVYAGEQSRHQGRPLHHELIRALR